MTQKLYWSATGIPTNAYNDGYITTYEAVSGQAFIFDALADYTFFTYEKNDTTYIIHEKTGVSIVNGENVTSATAALQQTISSFGFGTFKRLLDEKIKSLPSVPADLPTAAGEKVETIYTSLKTGDTVPWKWDETANRWTTR